MLILRYLYVINDHKAVVLSVNHFFSSDQGSNMLCSGGSRALVSHFHAGFEDFKSVRVKCFVIVIFVNRRG